jgi:hypothetical protein
LKEKETVVKAGLKEMVKVSKRLAISSVPESALVEIGTQAIGNTPTPLKLDGGLYTLKFIKPGFASVYLPLKVTESMPETVSAILSEVGYLRVAANPPGLSVSDASSGKHLQGDGHFYELPPGEHPLEFNRRYYNGLLKTCTIKAGDTLQMAINLEPSAGYRYDLLLKPVLLPGLGRVMEGDLWFLGWVEAALFAYIGYRGIDNYLQARDHRSKYENATEHEEIQSRYAAFRESNHDFKVCLMWATGLYGLGLLDGLTHSILKTRKIRLETKVYIK